MNFNRINLNKQLFLIIFIIIFCNLMTNHSVYSQSNEMNIERIFTLRFHKIRKEFLKDWGKDPFIPYKAPEKKIEKPKEEPKPVKKVEVKPPPAFASQDYNLTAVIYEPSRPLSIINENIFYKGDYIKGAKIIAIKPGEVILEKNKQKYTLRIKND